MELLIGAGGDVHCIYGEELDLGCLGTVEIRRASSVEPDDAGHWWADLSPVMGPRLGPFQKRSAALEAEVDWLRLHLPLAAEHSSKEQK